MNNEPFSIVGGDDNVDQDKNKTNGDDISLVLLVKEEDGSIDLDIILPFDFQSIESNETKNDVSKEFSAAFFKTSSFAWARQNKRKLRRKGHPCMYFHESRNKCKRERVCARASMRNVFS
jgi:hypothetical protein